TETRDELAALGLGKVAAVVCDVTSTEAVDALITESVAALGRIDVLVNNAGLALGLEPAHRASVEDWEDMIDTNNKGLVYMTRAVLPGMVERNRGH
ncbi:SDR family NAD(P)-dependent oxidoreductase, partial [Enterococcus faecalis]|uniref:SDR family NAD(P)-dependent oxidoreductase n=1 Tax=Enterococcus faecalis TaxID=1351 RepID=UPI0039864332